MKQKVKLPYCSRYFAGTQLKLEWLMAVTSNDYISARHLNWHSHDEMELIFPLRGHYRYEFKGRRAVRVDNESFIIIPGRTQHRLDEAIDPPGGRLHLYLRQPSARASARGMFTAQEYAQLYQTLAKKALKRIPSPALLKSSILSLGRIITRSPATLSDADKLQIRFLCCLALCNSATGEAAIKDRSPSHIIAEAINWLERNALKPVHMNQLIEHIGYSRTRFFALFKQQTNTTPSEYLRNYRLDKAKEMLVQTNLPVNHIGAVCGLGAPAQFSRFFSRMTGFTPLVYRHRQGRHPSVLHCHIL